VVAVSKLSLADFSGLSFTGKTVEFNAQPGTDGSYSPTSLTVVDQTAMANNVKGTKGTSAGTSAKAPKTKKAGATAATTTPGATSTSDRVVLQNVTVSGDTLTGTTATGTSVTVHLNDATTLNQRVAEKPSDLTAGDKLTVDFRAQGKKATGPANALAIVIEK